MAVEQPTPAVASVPIVQPKVRAFWPTFRRKTVFFVVCMQIIATLIVGCALIFGKVGDPATISFWIALLAIGATTVGINVIVFNQISDPIKQLTFALTHVAGEPTLTTPPNPNLPRFAKNGLRPLLQTIYELGVGTKTDQTPAAKNTSELSAALSTTSTGFIVLGPDRNVVYANQAAPVRLSETGTQEIELVFDNETTLEQWLDECDQKAVHAEKVWMRVANKIHGEENRRIFDINASYEKGSSAEVVLTFLERTAKYLPEDDDLDFIAFAAHELRGPITVIRGYLDVLGDELQPKLDLDQIELMQRLVVSANRLSSYVNNILNASRFDRRHLKVHLREDSLADIYDTIADDMSLRARAQNRLLSVNFPADLPDVAADRASISEVIGNLIDNAIKYSNEGGAVTVSASVSGDMVEVSVEDHGIGMPGNVVSNLFHKFYRSHRSRETVAGTGIGLYITKAIIESHGGRVGVKSQEGQGSTFTFSLPIYSTVADKLQAEQGSNESLIGHDEGWIKNHSMYRG